MKLWCLDASVLLASEDPGDHNHADAVRLLQTSDSLLTLDLAFFEVVNVAVRAWQDQGAAERLCARIDAIAHDGGLLRVDSELMAQAAVIAEQRSISAYDAAYVAAGDRAAATLVSCDVRDLVSNGLACTPGAACAER